MLAYSVMAKDKGNHGLKLCVGLKGHIIFKWYLLVETLNIFFFFVKNCLFIACKKLYFALKKKMESYKSKTGAMTDKQLN